MKTQSSFKKSPTKAPAERVVKDIRRATRRHGLVTVLRRSPEHFELATGDRRDDQAFRRVQARGCAYCADQWLAACAARQSR
ncbi:MAG: hypothetical protein CVT75_05465 [Alphaproteobacteria bacterium HGW-Alphaproteobacteria-14]|nr:MAG: hypothetical protein CVT75_05465 [Alphaproteobacteria bacterium HGW-Alphaproteobacteria-14]